MNNLFLSVSLFFKDAFDNRKMLVDLARNDFKSKYSGSILGLLWAFIQPMITICVFWFVFEIGFKNPPVEGVPFILWMLCGIVPWFFFSDAVSATTQCIFQYSYLVKKMRFRIGILPVVKLLSSLYIHIFLLIVTVLMFLVYGYRVDIYFLQLLYYVPLLILLIIGVGWFTSSVSPFIPDTKEFVQVVLQIGFWMTPIFWSTDNVPYYVRKIVVFNPMFYIADGFRDTLINKIWFWEKMQHSLIFYCELAVIVTIGVYVFKKLKHHFADVL